VAEVGHMFMYVCKTKCNSSTHLSHLKSKRSQSSLVVTTIETYQSVSRSVSCQRDLAHIGAEGYPQHLGGSDSLAVGCSRMELDSFNHSAVVFIFEKKKKKKTGAN
jgi:hypothetical protein